MQSRNFLAGLAGLFMIGTAKIAFSQIDFWQQTNGPFGGNIRCLAVDIHGKIFAGTARVGHGQGIFRSRDDGMSWEKASNGMPYTLFAGALDDTLYDNVHCLATNSKGFIFAGTRTAGVFRSTDSGQSWVQADTLSTNALVIDAHDRVFSGTAGHGVFRSINDGLSWQAASSGLANHPFIASLAIASTGHIFAGTIGGVFRSDDEGTSWIPVNSDMENTEVVAIAVNFFWAYFRGDI